MIIDCLNFCLNLAVVQEFVGALDKLEMALKVKWKTNGQDCEAVHDTKRFELPDFIRLALLAPSFRYTFDTQLMDYGF